MSPAFPRAATLALFTTIAGLALGALAIAAGLAWEALAFGGFGAACLLQVPLALVLRYRFREGLGNRGLDGERRARRLTGQFQAALALGLALAAAAALMGQRAATPSPWGAALALAAAAIHLALWRAKRGLADQHPTLDLEAARARGPLDLALLMGLGTLAGFWLPQADAFAALAMALRLFLEGRSLVKSTALPAACGGCGSGCGCG